MNLSQVSSSSVSCLLRKPEIRCGFRRSLMIWVWPDDPLSRNTWSSQRRQDFYYMNEKWKEPGPEVSESTTQGIMQMSRFLVNLIGEPSWWLLGKTPLWRNGHVTGAKPLGWVLRSTLFILSLVIGWVMLHFVFLSLMTVLVRVLGWNYDSWKKRNMTVVSLEWWAIHFLWWKLQTFP